MIFHRSKQKWIMIMLLFLSILFVFQFYWMLVTSLQRNTQLFKWPPTLIPSALTLDNYRALNWMALSRWFTNSLFVATCSAVLSVLVAGVGGYALARYDFRFRKLVLGILLLASVIPAQVILVPKFILVANTFHLYDKLAGMILPKLFAPLSVFLIHQYSLGLPQEVIDAARLDGAGEGILFWRIVLPMLKPILATVLMLQFAATWGDYLWQSVIIQSTSNMTAPVGIVLLGYVKSSPLPAIVPMDAARRLFIGIQPAAGLLLGIPTCVLFLLLQKYFIKGGFIQGG